MDVFARCVRGELYSSTPADGHFAWLGMIFLLVAALALRGTSSKVIQLDSQELHDVITTLVRLGDAAVATALPNRTHELDEYHVEKSLGDGSFGMVMSVRRMEDATSAPGPFVAYCTQTSALLNVDLAYNLMKTYARLQAGGNMRTFLALMLTFGKWRRRQQS